MLVLESKRPPGAAHQRLPRGLKDLQSRTRDPKLAKRSPRGFKDPQEIPGRPQEPRKSCNDENLVELCLPKENRISKK